MAEQSQTYEEIREIVSGLKKPIKGERLVQWVGERKVLGVAKDAKGQFQVFIVGPELEAEFKSVSDNLKFETSWIDHNTGKEFSGNLLSLPAAPHLQKAVAFICTELLSAGLDDQPQLAFTESEPLIDVWIQQLGITDESLTGLIGELLLFNFLAEALPHERLALLVDNWFGHMHSNRDFQLDEVGIEVKTTRGQSSSHHFSGVAQLEPGHGVDNQPETVLFVASIGIKKSEASGNSWTLPLVVERLLKILNRVPDEGTELQEKMLTKIKRYGGESRLGYDHPKMKDLERFNQHFTISFTRFYDMSDDRIEVIRSPLLNDLSAVDPSTLSYVAKFPTRVDGDLNPRAELKSAIAEIIKTSRWG